MDATVAFVRNITHTQYKDIPVFAVEAEKKQLLDTLGVALAGSSKPGVEELIHMVKLWGGSKQSTLINHGIKAPAPMAAQVNATMAHALDYDDGHRNQRADQNIRIAYRSQQSRSERSDRKRLWVFGAKRSRQDNDNPNSVGSCGGHGGLG